MEQNQTRDMRARPASQRQDAARRPRWPIPLALLGLLGLALAAILGWGVAPGRKQLPSDVNTTRDFSGTANTLLNPQALESGDAGNALMANVPVTGQRTVRVLDTSGNNARVIDERTLVSGGQPVGSGSHTYAVNRRSLEPATGAPSDWDVEPHQGLTVSFPIGAERRDYSGWVNDTQETTPIRFVREESRGGVNAFVYQSKVEPTPIRDQAVLSSLPTSLSRNTLQGIAPSLPLSADEMGSLSQALPSLPEQVPVTYTYEGATIYWVEPTTGTVIDVARQEVRTGTIAGPGGAVLASMPVYNVDTRYTDDSVAAAGRYASDRRNALNTVGSTWPWVLGTLGTLALLAGLLGLLARRRPQPQPAGPGTTAGASERMMAEADDRRRVDAPDAARTRQTEAGRPQPPYAGQTPHAGPYRGSTAGEQPHVEEAQHPGRGQPPPGEGRQPPPRS